MAKKRVTLPKEFKDLMDEGNIEALKAVYDRCELTAHDGRFSLCTPLHMGGVPDELVIWLVEKGLDINIPDYYGATPLYRQATMGRDTVKLLLELGADIGKPNTYGETPLHVAAEFFHPKTVKLLIDKGADVNAKNDMGRTPLASVLMVCRGIYIAQTAEIATMLVEAGAKKTSAMKEKVENIGKDFEFHREGIHPDYIEAADKGLTKLYEIFDVKPVEKRLTHDGVSPIKLVEGSWEEQYEELWSFLIPSSGPAKTVQGEAIRIPGRVRDELDRNGGVNWDRDYRKMLQALPQYLSLGIPLSDQELEETKELIAQVHGKGFDDEPRLDRLCQLAIAWIKQNPEPLLLEKTSYKR
ncbi:ankyrin repeat protein [Streptococcus sp. oral taxon 071 str. 73H25AP]|uniref:ankyrin repeat domain-containing protein n=1 Tax=Streptococcus sp. oral taxon 071 TaxID=712630 RepID=UPI0001E0FB58|nr:ankyrin repeat domain-containing protein [Streptococcus sp. oral taxon 071]EFM36110.1 ankyrin repeat protein [Streptococcus sp. oral taxon 071 str. 73H25AP]